jgi:hypothetical protein
VSDCELPGGADAGMEEVGRSVSNWNLKWGNGEVVEGPVEKVFIENMKCKKKRTAYQQRL